MGLERDLGASHLRLADLLQRCFRYSAPVTLEEDPLLPANLDLEKLRERVNNRNTNPMKPTRHFVRALVEFAPGMKLREHDFRRRDALCGMNFGRDAAAVVFDG